MHSFIHSFLFGGRTLLCVPGWSGTGYKAQSDLKCTLILGLSFLNAKPLLDLKLHFFLKNNSPCSMASASIGRHRPSPHCASALTLRLFAHGTETSDSNQTCLKSLLCTLFKEKLSYIWSQICLALQTNMSKSCPEKKDCIFVSLSL